MKRMTSLALAVTAVWLLLAAGRARADFVSFSYHWSVAPSSVIPGGTGSVSLTPAADGSTTAQTGVTAVLDAATVTTSSSAGTTPDSFNAPFSLGLDVKDTVSNATGHLTFSGTIAGTLTATSSSLTSTFDNPVTQTLHLGGWSYTVTIDPVVANLPAPNSQSAVLLDALTTVAADQPTTQHNSPEPSGLVLAASAASLWWLSRRRRIRFRVEVE
jgi:hypothetical protein